MYVPGAFAVEDPAVARELIARYGFATLISSGPDGLMATHVPVQYQSAPAGAGRLVAHLSRSNPHAAILDGAAVLTIFQGPHAYISPSWYATHPAVPTWNYAAVHVYGRARTITEPARLRDIVGRLVATYEDERPQPWRMSSVPDRYIDGMLNAVTGVEIDIERIEAKHKLSQNRVAEDRTRVIAALESSADAHDRELAAYMSRHASPTRG